MPSPGFSFWDRIRRWVRYGYLRIIRIKAPPESIALGLAVGVFVGCLPVVPFQTVLALALAFFCRCSKIAAALGTWVSNPANMVFLYYLFFKVGSLIVPSPGGRLDPTAVSMTDMLRHGWSLFLTMFVGGFLVGIPSAVITYFLAFKAIRSFLIRKAKRRMERLRQRPRP
ncbi:MAG: DUF2062 domain-containing protein [Deltaproteobacteria bacterium]|nr:DUF2062 domain-containing protein [Deltaproteobacteria bacterium]